MDTQALVLEALRLARADVPRERDAFESFLADLKNVQDDLAAFHADAEKQPWTRIHVGLVRSGLWSKLKPVSRSVYMTLAAYTDRRKRVTIVGAKRVGELSGYSVSRVLFAYRELKNYGLIWRQRIMVNGRRPYLTGLTNPGRWRP